MLLINKNVKPTQTIYYLSALVYKQLKSNEYDIRKLYDEMLKLDNEIRYQDFLYALNFLFLVDKIKIERDVIVICW